MELFALDLGNKQVKIKSSKTTKVLPAQFVEVSQYGNRDLLKFAKLERDTSDFVSSKDPDFTYSWGTDVDLAVEVVQDTIGFGITRYRSRNFKLLADFALAELAKDFEEAASGILEVAVVTGIPTTDYSHDGSTEILAGILKGDHNVIVNEQPLNIRVKEVTILPQPIGTVVDQLIDENGDVKDSYIAESNVGVVDIGGGTLLIDAINKMNMVDGKRNQLTSGAYTLYKAVVKKMAAKGYNSNEYEIANIIRKYNDTEKYIWSPEGSQLIDISDIIMKERLLFTRTVASAINSTYMDISDMRTILVTGGAANLVIKSDLADEIEIVDFVDYSEIANVNGFYKYGLQEGE